MVRPRGATLRPLSRRRSARRSAPSAAAASTSSKPAASSTSSEALRPGGVLGGPQAQVQARALGAQLELERALGVGDRAEAGQAGVTSSRRSART